MSTKTTFKRIALVTVAALGFGVLSTVPSSAAVASLTTTVTNGAATTLLADSTTAATITLGWTASTGATDSYTVQVAYREAAPVSAAAATPRILFSDSSTSVVGQHPTIESTAVTLASAFATAGFTRGGDVAYNASLGVRTTTGGSAAGITQGVTFKLYLGETSTKVVAGTYKFNVITTNGATVAITPVDIVVSKTAATVATEDKVATATYSKAILSAGATWQETASDSAVAVISTASATTQAVVKVLLRNAADAAALESVTATMTGPGLISPDGTTWGKSFVIQTAQSDPAAQIRIRADGTAGVGSLVISSTSVTFPAKSITFYSKAAKTITASVLTPVIATGANAGVIEATAVDANGANWAGTMYAYSADTATISSYLTTCAYTASTKTHACDLTGVKAGTASIKLIDAATLALATATSNAVDVRVSLGTPTTIKLSFDKASYSPFEKATISLSALDAAGLRLPAQTITNWLKTGGISSTVGFSSNSDTLTAVSGDLDGETGTLDYTVYMPAGDGDVVISATGGTGIAVAGQVKVSATATVANASSGAATAAAEEATAAANDATDAALSAAEAAEAATAMAQEAVDAVAELSASVTKLISALRAQITSLTNLVIKIQKKVKA
jgi:hypothetical protein